MSQPPAHQNLKFSEGEDFFFANQVSLFADLFVHALVSGSKPVRARTPGRWNRFGEGWGALSCNRQSDCQGGSTELPEFRVQEGKELSRGTEREQKSLREAAEKVIFF